MPVLPSARLIDRLRRFCVGLIVACGLVMVTTVHAEGIEARAASVHAHEDGWMLDAEFDIAFNPVLIDAVQRGVALYFVTEVEIHRGRWYWFDERVLVQQQNARLSYNALTSQYRVVIGAGPLALRFDDIGSAVAAIARVRNWHLGDLGLLQHGDKYTVQVRQRLDVAQLPKPFQLNAITNREWALASDWFKFSMVP